MNFYSSSNNPNKSNGFSASLYDPKNGLNKKKNPLPFKAEKLEPPTPEPPKNEGTEAMSSSVGFRLSSGEIKKGVTLDKVLGAGFKKIDIFDANLKEFENKSFLPPHIIDEKINEMSDVDGDEGDEKYAYESFEIVETENEEEGNPESQQGHRNQARKEYKDRPKFDATDEIKNNEILDKIQKKYKSSKSKQLYKKKSKLFMKPSPGGNPDNRSDNNDNPDSERDFPSKEELAAPERRGREYAIGKIESKSLSPKVNQDIKKPRFQAANYENPKPMIATQYNPYSN